MSRYELLHSEIRKRRLIAGFTQLQLAKASGISQSSISRIESGALIPDAVTLTRLVQPLQIDRRHLLLRAAITALHYPGKNNRIISEILTELRTAKIPN